MWRDSAGGKLLTFHAAEPRSVSGPTYGAHALPEGLVTTGCGHKQKQWKPEVWGFKLTGDIYICIYIIDLKLTTTNYI